MTSNRAAVGPSRIFTNRKGDTFYFDIESAVVADLCGRDACVIAFGAGTLMRPQNQAHARRDSLVVYVGAEPPELLRRIQSDPDSETTRPNLTGGGFGEVVEVLAKRARVYERFADVTMDATLPPLELAERIVVRLNGVEKCD